MMEARQISESESQSLLQRANILLQEAGDDSPYYYMINKSAQAYSLYKEICEAGLSQIWAAKLGLLKCLIMNTAILPDEALKQLDKLVIQYFIPETEKSIQTIKMLLPPLGEGNSKNKIPSYAEYLASYAYDLWQIYRGRSGGSISMLRDTLSNLEEENDRTWENQFKLVINLFNKDLEISKENPEPIEVKKNRWDKGHVIYKRAADDYLGLASRKKEQTDEYIKILKEAKTYHEEAMKLQVAASNDLESPDDLIKFAYQFTFPTDPYGTQYADIFWLHIQTLRIFKKLIKLNASTKEEMNAYIINYKLKEIVDQSTHDQFKEKIKKFQDFCGNTDAEVIKTTSENTNDENKKPLNYENCSAILYPTLGKMPSVTARLQNASIHDQNGDQEPEVNKHK